MLSVGKKFNRLTVVKHDHKDKKWRNWYLFKCDCGKKQVLHGSAVVSGNTKSCGRLSKEVKASMALPGGLGAMRQVILQNYKRGGKKRKWSLLETEFYEISHRKCYYCGEPPSQTRKGKGYGHDFVYNGLDRIDSRKEYTIDNVVSCCKRCNMAKNDMTIKEFSGWAKRLSAMAEQWG